MAMATINPVQVQKVLKGMQYPAGKETLMDTARSEGASGDIMNALEQLPDRQYDTPADVMKALADEDEEDEEDEDDEEKKHKHGHDKNKKDHEK